MSGSSVKSCQWNAAAYAANSTVQQSWARELIAKLKLRGDEHVLDVGCGDGKVTAEIARAVLRGRVLGVDASAEMIAFAKKTFSAAKNPNLKFQICDAREVESNAASFNLVFSNAALHWVDDHEKILRGAATVLKSGGQLVVSCGGKGNAHDVFLALR
ncbi:MAG TPA: class I SAM-dependent methyltransferase, partial [Verrucomicrobiae bacterium]|nr:class I SAM-dependent methyltransferase [Verrucomicrobiae bacterium]